MPSLDRSTWDFDETAASNQTNGPRWPQASKSCGAAWCAGRCVPSQRRYRETMPTITAAPSRSIARRFDDAQRNSSASSMRAIRSPANQSWSIVTSQFPRWHGYAASTGASTRSRSEGASNTMSSGVEGVWAGDFATTKIEESDCMFGSGAALGEQVVFVPPKHNYEHLFVLHDCALQRTYVTNSLCFVLAAAGSEIEESFLAMMPAGLLALGRLRPANIDFYDPLVCGNARFRLFKMMYYNFSADHAGVVKLHECRLHPPAGNFKEYRDHLSKQLGALFANARHPGRSTRFEPIATVSTGYDSVACAALAKEQGCVEALTLDVSVKGKDDHGGDVAASLGLRLISRRHVMGDDIANLRVEFSGHLQEAVAEFVATQGVGDDIAFQPFESCLSGRLLVTGGYGDTIWRRQPPTPPGLPTGTVFSKSITEFRLRVGFSYLPLPFIAARFPQAVNAISQSAEMQPFCLAQEYDRPIPRRIAEEAGVPREAFGQRKVATAPLPTNHQALFVASVRKVMNRYRQGIRRVPPPVA